MIALLLAQAAIPVAPPAPPPLISTRIVPAPRSARPRFRVAVVVRSGDGVLWSGSLWLSQRGGASWRQNMQEAQPDECETPAMFGAGAQSELGIQLNALSAPDDAVAERVMVNVRWSRPAASGCGGSRTVELRQAVPLDRRVAAVLRGDGGLVVELRRD